MAPTCCSSATTHLRRREQEARECAYPSEVHRALSQTKRARNMCSSSPSLSDRAGSNRVLLPVKAEVGILEKERNLMCVRRALPLLLLSYLQERTDKKSVHSGNFYLIPKLYPGKNKRLPVFTTFIGKQALRKKKTNGQYSDKHPRTHNFQRHQATQIPSLSSRSSPAPRAPFPTHVSASLCSREVCTAL